ncbi:TIGR04290 family methyltransferase [Pedosphaera parvula]|uniref:Methyltransferase type 12 n=1 Tax=Pedosphaera parvula (strain Ellin514) TaxID=320771 RepID=B9XGQ6_PEDPL|nr:TIGR04290 family methyltransferase [Pedosphaera parvula]EEF61107.1 Methyltransferase type 12 [Pedosphaera parvula Ellin514]
MKNVTSTLPNVLTQDEIQLRVKQLGKWFHNLDLKGVSTAPDHFLGDYPRIKWQSIADILPRNLSGKTVLDIGCNAGFYSIEMKRRGADRVLGIDHDDCYLDQAKFAAEVCGVDVEFQKLSVYDLGQLGEKFDLVLFMGVLYHLRHPLLALDLIYEHVAKDVLLFQSMQRGSNTIEPIKDNYSFWETEVFNAPGYPILHFVEKKYANDATNWWIPNCACSEAMLRSAGFEIVEHPEAETFVCRRKQ